MASYLPYFDLSLLTNFYRAYESRGGPREYQQVEEARETRRGNFESLCQPFQHQGGCCWTLELPSTVPDGDSLVQPHASRLLLFEDGRPIGPPHCEHALIERFGAGRFSHWNNTLYFSTSDDTDPNVNGRSYCVAIESEP